MREIVIPYCPRPQFEAYHDRTQRFAKIVAHRRFGKTVGCINDKIKQAITNPRQFPPPRYSYIAPTYSQAKDVAWGYLKFYCSAIPGLKVAESELYVEFPHNHARFRLYGADNYDRLRGTYNDDVTIDEPALMDPRAWPEVIRPTLADFNGGATFIGTPQGKDWFYRVDKDENGVELPDWFRLVLKASKTGVIPKEELESLRAGMSEDQYNREFECSFDAAVMGAYFGSLMSDAATEGRIGFVAKDPLLPLRAWIDIGGAGAKADAFTIWITQWVGQEIKILDYYESVGQVLATHVNWMRSRKYQNAVLYLPHDGANTNAVTGLTYAQHLYDAGFEVEVIGNQGKGAAAMRIEALRRILPRCTWNEATTGAGREAISHYHENRDDTRGIGLGPEHDWCLAADTQVLTPNGWRNVQDIAVHDQVLTPCGPRQILRSGIVRMTSEWTNIRGIRCTPEHRFFTSRGLVEAGELLSGDKFWTQDDLGLAFLASLCARLHFGLKTAIISVTPEGKIDGDRFSYTAWFMRLCMAKYRMGMKSTISTMIRSITILKTLQLCPDLCTEALINQNPDMSAFVGFAERNSAVIRNSELAAGRSVSEPIVPELNENVAPAYNLTVDIDECYFVRGDDNRAYLVSNSSHAADALGMMAIVYEPQHDPKISDLYDRGGYADSTRSSITGY